MFSGKVKIRSDGVPLAGTRKFTPDELVRYCRNMYGKSFYTRQQITRAKKFGHAKMSQIAYKARQTERERYTPEEISAFHKRGWETMRQSPGYSEKLARIMAHLKEPSVNEHRIATWQKKRERGELLSENSHAYRYFIVDCDIDGKFYEEGEYIDRDDPILEKANLMGVVAFYHQLMPETQMLARRHRQKVGQWRFKAVHWFDKRPGVIHAIMGG